MGSTWNERNPERVREARRRYKERQRLRRNGVNDTVLDQSTEAAVDEVQPIEDREEALEVEGTEVAIEDAPTSPVVWTQEEHDRILRAADLIIAQLATERRLPVKPIMPTGVSAQGLPTVDLVCESCGVLGRYYIHVTNFCHFCRGYIKKEKK